MSTSRLGTIGNSRRNLVSVAVAGILALTLFVPAGAQAAAVATTGTASNVTQTSADLSGTADPTTTDAEFCFDYGTTSSYGQVSSCTPLTSTGAQPITEHITGLSPGTTYHFELVVIDLSYPSTTSRGGDASFTTLGTATATTSGATSVTSTSATVHGVANPPTDGAQWSFQFGPTKTYGSLTGAQTINAGVSAVSAQLTNLTPSTTYHYRLVVASGNPLAYATGADRTFKTAAKGKTNAPKYGTAKLLSRRLKVKHGVVSMRFKCAGPKGSLCKGKVSLHAKSGKHTVGCGSGTFVGSGGNTHTVRAKIGRTCAALLGKASKLSISATLNGKFSTHQKALKRGVTVYE
jgi:hypothetical protein